ncbi:hypothetical protein LCGC14_1731070 [marine sediment metagenome]|uniref:Uncharacterized protein n=1 Tax=marine sediment metagenome TaxID=412755 RepID=A0A0F9H9G0_9ZZZZ
MNKKTALTWLLLLAVWVLTVEYFIITPSVEEYHLRLGDMAKNSAHVIRTVFHICFTFGPAILIASLVAEKGKKK